MKQKKAYRPEKIICVSHITKKFNGLTAVDDISFDVHKGEIFAFLGPNGAGKTTTIKMLTTLLSANSGFATVNSYNIETQKDLVRNSFGIVFQDPSLDNELTALENMEFHASLYSVPKEIRKKRIEYLLKFVELWDRKNDYVKKFSGGMKRRLEIARGLIHHPKVLFLDEPTLGLDPQTRTNIWEHIQKLVSEEKMTVFFTTHYMGEAERVASCVAIIDHGQIITQGSPKYLKKMTRKKTLEDAFLKITGRNIRQEDANPLDRMRLGNRVWRH